MKYTDYEEEMVQDLEKAKSPDHFDFVSVKVVRDKRMAYNMKPLNDSEKVYNQFSKVFRNEPREKFAAVFLDTQMNPIGAAVIGIGSCNLCAVDKPGIFRTAILLGATGLILMHNHPSTVLDPSVEDLNVTRAVIDIGKLLGICVLDHIIFGDFGYRSMRDHGDVKFGS